MDRIAFLTLCRSDDSVDVNIGGGSGAAQCHVRICQDAMAGIRIIGGVNGDALNSQVTGCAKDPDCDFAAVSN
jgi:hypothetical protein